MCTHYILQITLISIPHNNVETLLTACLQDWFQHWPRVQAQHTELRENIDQFRGVGWDQNWDAVALPVFRDREPQPTSGAVLALFFIGVFCVFSAFLPTVM